MPKVSRLRVFPVKGLDGIDVDAAEVLEGGTLTHDREFALFDSEGTVVNGKQTERVHDLRTDFNPESATFHVDPRDGDAQQFNLETDREEAADWFSDYFSEELTMQRDASLGFVDRREMGPSVISTATLERVASWFDDVTTEGARRRLRANIEISGVPAFWEDRFIGDDAPMFEIDSVRFEGVTPCGRCVVPQRDPDTGEPVPEFRTKFIENRREEFPEWADEDAFDHYYTLMIITRIREADRGKVITIGDEVTTLD